MTDPLCIGLNDFLENLKEMPADEQDWALDRFQDGLFDLPLATVQAYQQYLESQIQKSDNGLLSPEESVLRPEPKQALWQRLSMSVIYVLDQHGTDLGTVVTV